MGADFSNNSVLLDWNERIWQGSSVQDLEKLCRSLKIDGELWAVDFLRFVCKGQDVFISSAYSGQANPCYSDEEYQKLRKALKSHPTRRKAYLQVDDMHVILSDYLCVFWKSLTVCPSLINNIRRELSWFEKLQEAETLIYQDDLTGLFNYRYLEILLESEVRRSQRFQIPFSLIFLDVDNFKLINDTHGHLVGSSMLKQVARVIGLAVREVDSVFRYGGDEFVVLALGANTALGLVIGERIRAAVEGYDFSAIKPGIQTTLSVGVASCPEQGRSPQELLQFADRAMYASKSNGKNRVTRYIEGENHEFRSKISEKVLG